MSEDLKKPIAAVVGSGNIGTDLVYKLLRSKELELRYLVGIDPESEGLARAKALGLEVSADGVDWLLSLDEPPDLVFEATSAKVHLANAPRYKEANIRAIDLTPAACGPYVVPSVNLEQHAEAMNVNLVTCGGQATIPIVSAVSRVVPVEYAEIVATVASKSAGPGTRANIDEFTRTTASAVAMLGNAANGKAIIILNPAEPPLIMRDTIYCSLPPDADTAKVEQSIRQMVDEVSSYVPGYRLVTDPQFDEGRVVTFIEVEGNGDFLPKFSGNLDIMTAAAARVGDVFARQIAKVAA